MITHHSIIRTSQKMISFLEEHSKTSYNGSLEEFLPVLQNIQNIFPQWVLMTCPVKHAQTRFITENCNNVLGFSADFFRRSLTPEIIFSRIHEDDVADLNQCFLFMNDFFRNNIPAEYPLMRCVFQYRYKRDDGSCITLHDEKAILSLSDNTHLYYSVIKDISNDVVFTGVSIDIYKRNAVLERVASFRPQNENKSLSKRETELVGLIKRGLTTKEMAYHLNISHYTVRNMKQKMFEKYNVNNAIELLNKTIQYN